MRTRLVLVLVLILGLPAASADAQTPLSLAGWSAESYPTAASHPLAVWTLAPDGLSVNQTLNSAPGVFLGDVAASSGTFTAAITCNTFLDNDLMGFVLGFQPGDATNPAADYLLIDWKKTFQVFDYSGDCTGSTQCAIGLAVSRVTGVPTLDELWGHVDLNEPCSPIGQGVTELARAAFWGFQAWTTGQTYVFTFAFTPTGLDVWVDGNLEISITGTFQDGPIGFYGFSQEDVTYGPVTFACGLPAAAAGYGTPGPGGAQPAVLAVDQAPVLGGSVQAAATSSDGAPKIATLLLSSAPAALTIPGLSFPILVDPAAPGFVAIDVLMPAGGWVATVPVADDPALCGLEIYAQMLQYDGILAAWVGSNGLALTYGG